MLLPLLATLALFDSLAMPTPVDRYSILSPDRSLELFVMPDDRYGKAGAQYTLTGPDGERYDVHHDFRLHEAHVFDTGQVAGYFETRWDDETVRAAGSYLVVLALDADGAIAAEEWSRQDRVGGRSRRLDPQPLRLVPLAESGTFIVETWVKAANGAVWQAYALDGGHAGGAFRVPMGDLVTYAETRAWVRRPFEPLVGSAGEELDGWRTRPNARDEAMDWRKGNPNEVAVLQGAELVLECWVLHSGDGDPRTTVLNVLDSNGRMLARRTDDDVLLPPLEPALATDPATGELVPVGVEPIFDILRIDATRPRFSQTLRAMDGSPGEEVAWEVREVEGGWQVVRLEGDAQSLVVEARRPPHLHQVPERPVAVISHDLEHIESRVAPFEVVGGEFDGYSWVAPALFDDSLAWQVDAAGVLLILRIDDDERLVCARYDAELQLLEEVALADDGFWKALGVGPELWGKPNGVPHAMSIGGDRFVLLGDGLDIALVELVARADSSPGSPKETGFELQTVYVGSLFELEGVAALGLFEDVYAVSVHGLPAGGLLFDVDSEWNRRGRWLIALDPLNSAQVASESMVPTIAWSDQSEEREAGRDFEWSQVTSMADGRVVALDGRDLLRLWSPEGQRLAPVAFSTLSPTHGRPLYVDWIVRLNDREVLLGGLAESVRVDLETGKVSAVDSDCLALMGEADDTRLERWSASNADGAVWARGPHAIYRVATSEEGPVGRVVEARIARGAGLQRPDAARILDDGLVVVIDGLQARLMVWDPMQGEAQVLDIDPQLTMGLDDDLKLEVLPDGRLRVGTWSPWPHVKVLFRVNQAHGAEGLEHRVSIDDSVWTPDGRFRWTWHFPGVLDVFAADGTHVRTIEQHGRGLWWDGVYAVWFAEDGSVWVKEGNASDPHVRHHVRYTPDGVELEVVRATDAHPDGDGTLFDGPFALSGNAIYANPNGPAPRKHVFPDLDRGTTSAPASAPGELWHFELKTLTLHRYRMPSSLQGL